MPGKQKSQTLPPANPKSSKPVKNADALAYELADMERAINGDASAMHLDYTKDVMDLMTSFRRTWGYTYPEEEK